MKADLKEYWRKEKSVESVVNELQKSRKVGRESRVNRFELQYSYGQDQNDS